MSIMVTGATGQLGQLIIKSLLEKQNVLPKNIIACCRDPSKPVAREFAKKGIVVHQADYNNLTSLAEAFYGAETLMFISSGTLENRIYQHLNVINAARAVAMKHIIYTGFVKCPTFSATNDHVATEAALARSGIPYTVFRNSCYMELIPMFLGDALTTGQFNYPAGTGKCSFFAKADLADALARICTGPARHANKRYDVVGIKSYTFKEVAEIVSKTTGKPCVYKSIPIAEYRNKLKATNMKDLMVNLLVTLAESIAAGQLDISNRNLETILKRRPLTLEEVAPTLFQQATS